MKTFLLNLIAFLLTLSTSVAQTNTAAFGYGSVGSSPQNKGNNGVNIGRYAGENISTNGDNNIFIGYSAGRYNYGGDNNTSVGAYSGFNSSTGGGNAFFGFESGMSCAGYYNVFMGFKSGRSTQYGTQNTMLGHQAGYTNQNGGNNVYLGAFAGYTNNSGSGNVFIGSLAGYNETSSNKLYIDNSNTASPLIWGDFSSDHVNINGELGIGVSSPSNKLDVNGGIDMNDYLRHNGDDNTKIGFNANDNIIFQTSGSTRMEIESNGEVGIGTTSPNNKLDVNGGIDMNNYLRHNGDENTHVGFPSNDKITLRTSGSDRITVTSNGNVGIGTSTPDVKFEVNGKINAEEIEVKDVGADYVFASDYDLMPLSEVAKYIKANNHLPGIAPATETEKGVELGVFTEKLLEKIEELTLHLIEKDQQMEKMQKEINALKKQMK